MKRAIPITTLFLDSGGILLTDGWDHHARLEEYSGREVFYQKRPFTLRKSDEDIVRLASDIAQAPARQVVYIENTPMFVRIAE
jgi:hypothetical protein